MTLSTLLPEMKQIEKIRDDINIPLNALTFWDDGTITNLTYGELVPSEVTIAKLCSMYKLSYSHIKTLIAEKRLDLVADQFNHFLSKDSKVMKLRLVGNRIKGIVAKDYKKFDDYDVFSQVDNYLNDLKLDYNLETINKDDEYTRLRLMFNDTATNMGIAVEDGTEKDMVKGGFEITNSEIGLRGMSVNSLVYRQVCSNGMMGWGSDNENNEIFYKRGQDFNPFSRQNILESGISKAVSKSTENIVLFKKTKDIVVADPNREIIKISNRYSLGKNNAEGIQEAFKCENQNNYFGVINGITRFAKDNFKRDYRNRSKMEFVANDVLNKITSKV